jgi:hypothetical protein
MRHAEYVLAVDDESAASRRTDRPVLVPSAWYCLVLRRDG